MFSLIITIISIALVAALALATLFYGGSAYNAGSAKAEASKILLQGQQLLGASELYFSEHSAWPSSIEVLVQGNYLKQAPNAKTSGVLDAVAAGETWIMVPNVPTFVLITSAKEVCAEVNNQASLKQKAVLKQAYASLTAQCFGPSEVALKTVFRKALDTPFNDGAAIGVPTIEIAGASGVPVNPLDPGWLLGPVVLAGSGPVVPVVPVVVVPTSGLAIIGDNFGGVDTGTKKEIVLSVVNYGPNKVIFDRITSNATKMWQTGFVSTTCKAESLVASVYNNIQYAITDLIPAAHAGMMGYTPKTSLSQVNFDYPWAVPGNSSCTITVLMDARNLGPNNQAPGIGTLNNSTLTLRLEDYTTVSRAVTGTITGVVNDNFRAGIASGLAAADGAVHSILVRIFNDGNTLMKSVTATVTGAGFFMPPGGFVCADIQPAGTCTFPVSFQMTPGPVASGYPPYLLNGVTNVSVTSGATGTVFPFAVAVDATYPGGPGESSGSFGNMYVYFYGSVSTNVEADPANTLALSGNFIAACAGAGSVGATNTCVANQVRSMLGGSATCGVQGGNAQAPVLGIFPTAKSGVWAYCTGIQDKTNYNAIMSTFGFIARTN